MATPRFAAAALVDLAGKLLGAAGLPAERARAVAEVLVEGDLLGHTTHGLALLGPYLQSLADGQMEGQGEPGVIADHGSALTWDGRYLPGAWLVRQALATARERLAANPVVTVVIRHSHHIGCLQAYLKPVTDDGLFLLLSCSDPAAPTVAPHGGVEGRFAPNPLAAGIPTAGDPILIDISTSTTANGVVNRAAAAGEKLPGAWLVDRAGRATDDPRAIADGRGALLPLGGTDLGYKGFALALIVEAMTHALAGHQRAAAPPRWSASVFLQLIDPARFGGRAAFLREMSGLADSCRGAAVPPGAPPVRLPGQGALARRQAQLADGIALHPTILPALGPWLEKLGVSAPVAL